jgi:pimeloyl-ACP methyl ester carboxylesterase
VTPVSASIRNAAGRQIGYAVWGDVASGLPVIVHCHGTPGSRIPMYPVEMPEGFVHVSLDRPGYGLSEPEPGRNMASHAADVAVVLDRLEVGRFSVFGWSGGAAPALGVAAALPERVGRAVVGAGRAPVDAPVFPAELRDGVLSDLDGDRADCEVKARLYRDDRDAFFAWMESFLPEVDEFRRLRPNFIRCYDEAFATGGEGWFEDDVQLVSPWGFDLADVRCEVQLWHAEADGMVPIADGRYLAGRLQRCDPHLVAGDQEGHGTLIRHLPEMCRWLALGL